MQETPLSPMTIQEEDCSPKAGSNKNKFELASPTQVLQKHQDRQ